MAASRTDRGTGGSASPIYASKYVHVNLVGPRTIPKVKTRVSLREFARCQESVLPKNASVRKQQNGKRQASRLHSLAIPVLQHQHQMQIKITTRIMNTMHSATEATIKLAAFRSCIVSVSVSEAAAAAPGKHCKSYRPILRSNSVHAVKIGVVRHAARDVNATGV